MPWTVRKPTNTAVLAKSEALQQGLAWRAFQLKSLQVCTLLASDAVACAHQHILLKDCFMQMQRGGLSALSCLAEGGLDWYTRRCCLMAPLLQSRPSGAALHEHLALASTSLSAEVTAFFADRLQAHLTAHAG